MLITLTCRLDIYPIYSPIFGPSIIPFRVTEAAAYPSFHSMRDRVHPGHSVCPSRGHWKINTTKKHWHYPWGLFRPISTPKMESCRCWRDPEKPMLRCTPDCFGCGAKVLALFHAAHQRAEMAENAFSCMNK